MQGMRKGLGHTGTLGELSLDSRLYIHNHTHTYFYIRTLHYITLLYICIYITLHTYIIYT